jgi:hypothetical protein
MSTFTKSMFDSIKDALTKEGTSNKTADIMRTRPGNSYEVRLLPNVEDPSKTFYHYFSHGWTSFATGQYVTAVSPTTWGDRDPIAEHRFKVYRTGSAEEKKKSEAVFRREQWLVNVYVINDPTNPENNDTVKILMEAVQGEDADQFGERIFDLTENGSTFRIRCDKQGEFPTYVSSKFLIPGAVDGLDSPRIKEIYNSCHSLDETFRVKSYDELKQMLDEHYHCNESATSEVLNNTPPPDDYGRKEEVSKDPALDEEVPMTFDKEQKTPIEPDTEMDPLEDDKVKELLAGLDDV